MPLARRSPQLETWSAPQCPFLIEYDPNTFEEIGREVSAGMRAAHGGVEVGGLLFGTFDGARVRILHSEPVQCEHAYGPSFTLSEYDQRILEERLAEHAQLSRSDGYAVVGWYHSHLGGGPAFGENDIAIHDQYFPELWQVLLLQRPDVQGHIRTGFFFREAGARPPAAPAPHVAPPVREPAPSFHEPAVAPRERPVALKPNAPAIPPVPPVAESPAVETPAPQAPAPVATIPQAAALEAPAPQAPPELAPLAPAALVEPGNSRAAQSKLVWAALAVMFALCAATILYLRSNFLGGERNVAPGIVQVEAAKRDGFVEVSWDKGAIGSALKGRMEVNDGSIRGYIPLDRNALVSGRMPYRPTSDIANFHLVIERIGGGLLEGSTTFVAPPGSAATMAGVKEPQPVAATATATTPAPTTRPPSLTPVAPTQTVAAPQKDDPTATPQTTVQRKADVAINEKTVELPKLEPLAAPEPIQIAQVQRPLVPDRALAMPGPPVASAPPAASLAPAPSFHLAGRWLLKPGGYSRSPAVPESLAITVTDANGGLHGTLEARYRSRSKTDRIHFSFSGKASGASARFPWTAADGQRGEIEFIRVPNSADVVEVVWHGPESKQVFDELLKRVN